MIASQGRARFNNSRGWVGETSIWTSWGGELASGQVSGIRWKSAFMVCSWSLGVFHKTSNTRKCPVGARPARLLGSWTVPQAFKLIPIARHALSISLSFCPCHCCRGCLMISLPFSADNLLPPWSIDLWKDGTKPRHHAMIVLLVTVHGSYHVSRRQRFHRA